MALKQTLSQEQKQLQRLSPLQLQLVPLLQMNNLEIEEKVMSEINDNPALEVSENNNGEQADNLLNKDEEGDVFNETAEDIMNADYKSEDDIPYYRTSISNRSADDETPNAIIISQDSLVDYLMEQVQERKLTETQLKIAQYIIGNIDDSGYLTRRPDDITDDLIFQIGLNVSEEEVKNVLKIVQELDPAGVGAVDLQDCLRIQLERKIAEGHETSKLSLTVVTEHFDKFSKKHYDKIMSVLGIDEKKMAEINDDIRSLTPKPGNAITGIGDDSHSQQITPDFSVEIDGDNISLTLINNIPELQISESYSTTNEIFSKNKPTSRREIETARDIKEKYEKAKNFISVLKMRQETLFNTMEYIISHQREFFIEGDEEKIRPMILKDISKATGYDLSVISRAMTNKYVMTQWGVFPLKFFFSEGIQHESGEEVSTREILSILKSVISEENKSRPFSDEQLCSILKKKGYKIARRTISKYREKLSIPVARLRKEI